MYLLDPGDPESHSLDRRFGCRCGNAGIPAFFWTLCRRVASVAVPRNCCVVDSLSVLSANFLDISLLKRSQQGEYLQRSRIVDATGRWTGAGPLNTMTLAQRASCPGADHGIVAPAPLPDQRLRCPGLLAAQTFGRPPA